MQRKALAQLVRIKQVGDIARRLDVGIDVQRVRPSFEDLRNRARDLVNTLLCKSSGVTHQNLEIGVGSSESTGGHTACCTT